MDVSTIRRLYSIVMPWFVFNLLSLPTDYIFSPSLIFLYAGVVCTDCLWMNACAYVCPHEFIYLFRWTASRWAKEKPSIYVNSHETWRRGGERTEKESKSETEKRGSNKRKSRGAARLGNDSESHARPGGKGTAGVAPSPPGACWQGFNAAFNVWTAQQEKEEEKGVVGQEILSTPSWCQTQVCVWLCCCCHLRDALTSSLPSHSSSQHTHTHRETWLHKHKEALFHQKMLTDCLCCLPLGSIRSQHQACPHMEYFGRTPSLISPCASLIKSSWTFLWRGGGIKGGKLELLPNMHSSRQVTQTCLPCFPSGSPFATKLLFFLFITSTHCRFEKGVHACTIWLGEAEMSFVEKGNGQVFKKDINLN